MGLCTLREICLVWQGGIFSPKKLPARFNKNKQSAAQT